MLDSDTKQKIDSLRNILVGKIPNPQSQVEQITTGLIYKFMYDMDQESIEMGGEGSFFVGDYEKYSWNNLFDTKLSGVDKVKLYSDAIEGMYLNPNAPELFRNIFKNAFLPFKDPSTLNMFLKEVNEFHYSHSEKLGDAFEYLISIMGSQGDAGQFRTPRHIIDFIVEIINPQKHETVLDPACGTGGFLISSYKHILKTNTDKKLGDLLSASDRKKVGENIGGYDISPEMIKLSLVNMYLHGFSTPDIEEYDTLSSEDKWNEYYDVILANPPFFSPSGGIRPHKRFGVESKKAEVLFTSYILDHLKPNGRAGIIIPEGIIFQTGKAYKELRKQLIENTLIGVISLPQGIFNPYAGVKTSILILDKKLNKELDFIFFAEIKNDGFSLSAQRTPIKENDIPNILKGLENVKDSTLINTISKDEIQANNFALTYGTYQQSEARTSNFPIVELGEVCKLINGKAYKKEELLDKGKYPVLRVGNFFTNRSWFYSDLELDEDKYCDNGDLLYAWSASFGAKIWDGSKSIYHYHIWKMVPDQKVMDKVFLKYLMDFMTNSFKESEGRGGIMMHLTKSGMEKQKIPLPPLEVQQEIVDELEGYQKIIDGCKQVVENYKPTIDIDPSWEMVELEEVLTKITDGSHHSPETISEGMPYITVRDLTDGVIDFENCKKISNKDYEELVKNGCKPELDDILFSKDGTVGKTALIKEPTDFVVLSSLAIITPNSKMISPKYLYIYLSTDRFINEAISQKTGVAIRRIVLKTLKKIRIPIPSVELQQEIVQKIEEERKVIKGNKKLIETYTQKIQDRINKVWGEE